MKMKYVNTHILIKDMCMHVQCVIVLQDVDVLGQGIDYRDYTLPCMTLACDRE